jgi:hypothetical protein
MTFRGMWVSGRWDVNRRLGWQHWRFGFVAAGWGYEVVSCRPRRGMDPEKPREPEEQRDDSDDDVTVEWKSYGRGAC